eukprot:scaffold9631_cov35-Tisochrysis_lutea.AAC.2
MRNEPPCMPSPKWTTSGMRTAFAAYIARRPSASPRNMTSDGLFEVFTKYSRSSPSTAILEKEAQPEPPIRERDLTGPRLLLIHSSASWSMPIVGGASRELGGPVTLSVRPTIGDGRRAGASAVPARARSIDPERARGERTPRVRWGEQSRGCSPPQDRRAPLAHIAHLLTCPACTGVRLPAVARMGGQHG